MYRPWIVVLSLTLTASTAATAAEPTAGARLGINLPVETGK
jgi:hypothetical protein